MNQTFMVMAIAKGLDGAIMNPLDKKMMAKIIAAEALAGKDNFCMNYLKAFRAGMFEDTTLSSRRGQTVAGFTTLFTGEEK